MGVNVTGGDLTITGGSASADGSGAGNATAAADAGILAGGVKTIGVSGNLSLMGGSAATSGTGLASASAIIDPGQLDVTAGGDVSLTGGTQTGSGVATATIAALGPINMTLGGSLNITGSLAAPVQADASSPITITYTGGGTQAFTTDAVLGVATIRTGPALVPPPLPPAPAGELIEEPLVMPPEAVVAAQLTATVESVLSTIFVPEEGEASGEGGTDGRRRLQSCR